MGPQNSFRRMSGAVSGNCRDVYLLHDTGIPGESSARIAIASGRQQPDARGRSRRGAINAQTYDSWIETQIGILESDTLVRRVVAS